MSLINRVKLEVLLNTTKLFNLWLLPFGSSDSAWLRWVGLTVFWKGFLFVIMGTCLLATILGWQFESFYPCFTGWGLVATVRDMLLPEHSQERDFHPHQHQVVKIPRNLANYPSNPCIGLISVKRIALCINPRKGGIGIFIAEGYYFLEVDTWAAKLAHNW